MLSLAFQMEKHVFMSGLAVQNGVEEFVPLPLFFCFPFFFLLSTFSLLFSFFQKKKGKKKRREYRKESKRKIISPVQARLGWRNSFSFAFLSSFSSLLLLYFFLSFFIYYEINK